MAGTRFAPSGALRGSVMPPPDKSVSHRAAILAAMAPDESHITDYLDSADTRSTLAAVEALGAEVEITEAEAPGALDVRVRGIGLRGPAATAGLEPLRIDVGNAGTLLRLLPGWLAGQPSGAWELDGDESIRRRPVDRVANPLREMGAFAEARDGRLPPLRIEGRQLRGITYKLPVASAQVKSCLLLAGLLADGETEVIEPAPSRDHTERMLRAAGASVRSEPYGTNIAIRGELPGRRVSVSGTREIRAVDYHVPADFSSAAFHIAGALLVPGSSVVIEGTGLNPTRIGLLGILNRMGAAIEVEELIPVGGEPRGVIRAHHGPLEGTRVAPGEVPLAIDELPLVALVGCFAEGETIVRGAEELRHKETDRIAAVVDGLCGLGADIEALDDGFVVRGTGGLRGGTLDSRGDHRLAMIGALAGLASREGVEVLRMEAAAVSYPGFTRDLESLLG